MKKKLPLIIICLVAAVAVILALCLPGKEEETNDRYTNEEGLVVINLDSPVEETTKKSSEKSMNSTVKVSLPLSFVEEEYRDNLDSYAEAKGYKSAKMNDDGTVQIVMREFTYDLILSNVGLDAIKAMCKTIESKNYPYVLGLTKYNSDFSYIVMTVDSEKFEKAENAEKLFSYISECAFEYQSYDNSSSGQCEILLVEEGTNVLLGSKTVSAPENAD